MRGADFDTLGVHTLLLGIVDVDHRGTLWIAHNRFYRRCEHLDDFISSNSCFCNHTYLKSVLRIRNADARHKSASARIGRNIHDTYHALK